MKKAIMLTGVAVLSLLVICSLVFALSGLQNDNTPLSQLPSSYSKCVLSCVNTSQVNHAKCVDDYKNATDKCLDDYKKCSAALNNTNKTEFLNALKDCRKVYSQCDDLPQKNRDSCIKSVVNDSKVCKDNCKSSFICTGIYNPICGADNKTYSNECELKKTNITKSCNGECPCYKEKECAKEGESIPVIPNPLVCCDGLKLIKPKQENIVGISGYCTAKCGDGVCDNKTETNYNCPQDCNQTRSSLMSMNNLVTNDNHPSIDNNTALGSGFSSYSTTGCLKKGEIGICGRDKCCSGLKEECMQTSSLGSVASVVCTEGLVSLKK